MSIPPASLGVTGGQNCTFGVVYIRLRQLDQCSDVLRYDDVGGGEYDIAKFLRGQPLDCQDDDLSTRKDYVPNGHVQFSSRECVKIANAIDWPAIPPEL